MKKGYQLSSLGDAAVLIEFSKEIDDAVNAKVLHLFERLRNIAPFIKDVIPAYGSLTVCYDVYSLRSKEKTAFERIEEILVSLLEEEEIMQNFKGREVQIPVCYAQKFALDIDEMAEEKNISIEEIIQLHTSISYRVYMIGFLPGFPYMGKVDGKIATPRKASPRKSIPAGSVGIAGEQTGIYPLSSPGGWNIIGRTPQPLFDKEATNPVLLQPGDHVTFYSITEDEFENYQRRSA